MTRDLKSKLGLPRKSFRNRQSRCFELAWGYLCDSREDIGWALVHGEVDSALGRMGHAWLELGDTVYDAVLDELFPTADYRLMFTALEIARYSREEAAQHAVSSVHSGPWIERRWPNTASANRTRRAGEGRQKMSDSRVRGDGACPGAWLRKAKP